MAKPEEDLLYDILHKATEAYPEPLDVDPINKELGDSIVTGAIDYLVDHQLVDVLAKRSRISGMGSYAEIRINARGMDILQEDGGWTAMLNVVTVRLEADTLRQLITQKIDESNEPTHRKLQLREWVFSLSEQSLRGLAIQLIQTGLQAGVGSISELCKQIGNGQLPGA